MRRFLTRTWRSAERTPVVRDGENLKGRLEDVMAYDADSISNAERAALPRLLCQALRHTEGVRGTSEGQGLAWFAMSAIAIIAARTRKFALSMVLSALLTQPSNAQSLPKSPRQKAEEARKKADEKATDEAYKALIKRMPDHP